MKAGSTTFLELAPDPAPARPPETEVLFREARRRRQKRWLVATMALAAVVAGALVATGLGSRAPARGATRTPQPVGASGSHRVRIFYVASAAMEPTLVPGDRVAADTRYGHLQAGDVVVFTPPSAQRGPIRFEIKRIIALPGQSISSSGNSVLIDGKPLSPSYLTLGQLGPAIVTQVVPAGRYFVLGDNRRDSEDSRFYGPIPARSVVGVITSIVAPPSRAGPISG